MKLIIIIHAFLLITLTTGIAQVESENPKDILRHPNTFNFIFKYGVTSRNVLNTFEGTFTRDGICDPDTTIAFPLTDSEMDLIYTKMMEINFFEYPDTLKLDRAPKLVEFDSSRAVEEDTSMLGDKKVTIIAKKQLYLHTEPNSDYHFRVVVDRLEKKVFWNDGMRKGDKMDPMPRRLEELIKLIKKIIYEKPEYKALPRPRGGYM